MGAGAVGAKQTKRVIEMMLLYLLPFIFLKNDIMINIIMTTQNVC